ncbi:MAG: metallophosphoesterase [Bacteroidota bacterium]
MKRLLLFCFHLCLLAVLHQPLSALDKDSLGVEIAFTSDTQQPMWVEALFLHSNQNTRATDMVFDHILSRKPKALYLLGDVVSLGYRNRTWGRIDHCVNNCRINGIEVHALLGNHDVMGRAQKGESRFQKRFPDHIRTGYVSVTDSVAIVMLNSNFGTLSKVDLAKQQAWYEATLATLDSAATIQSIIVTCHHPPYSNSKLVGSSKSVQQRFVPAFLQSTKSSLFITGHSHAFEHFKKKGKSFLIIGGGGGLNHPLNTSVTKLEDAAADYKPMFHYLIVKRTHNKLLVTSYFLKTDFSGFEKGYTFKTGSS